MTWARLPAPRGRGDRWWPTEAAGPGPANPPGWPGALATILGRAGSARVTGVRAAPGRAVRGSAGAGGCQCLPEAYDVRNSASVSESFSNSAGETLSLTAWICASGSLSPISRISASGYSEARVLHSGIEPP